MALNDSPRTSGHITPRLFGIVFKDAFNGWWRDNVPQMGASLAYYTLFAFAPVLLIVVAVGGFIFGAEAVRGEIVGQIQGLVGRQGAEAIQAMLKSAGRSGSAVPITIVGIVTFVLGATGAFLELQSALNAIWRVKPPTRGGFFRDLLMQRLISFGLVMGFAFLLITALVVSAALAALNTWIGDTFPGAPIFWQGVDVIVSLGVLTLLFAMIYRVMPDVRLGWRDVWIGALVTSALFTIGKALIGLYLGASTFNSTYGAAGSIVVILVWVYYSSQVLLLGAEFTRAYVERVGGKAVPRSQPGKAEP